MRHTAATNVQDSFGSAEALFNRLGEVLAVCTRLVETLDGEVAPVRRVWLLPKEAASYLRLHPVTLAKLRSKGSGPRFSSQRRFIRYHVNDLDSYLRSETSQQEVADAKRCVSISSLRNPLLPGRREEEEAPDENGTRERSRRRLVTSPSTRGRTA